MRIIQRFLRALWRLVLWLLILICLIAILITIPSWWRHFVTYPRRDRELRKIEAARRPVAKPIPLRDFKGTLHNHCYWSHDSRGILEEILPAAKAAGLNFVFFTDHPRSNRDSFPRAYHGRYGNVLLISGSEKKGLLVWPLDSTTIDWTRDRNAVIRQVTGGGGLAFYAHTENPHAWRNPDYQGMEIYNIHTDFMDEDLFFAIVNAAINKGKYHHWIYRDIFDEQKEILARWDSLNTWRRIVGIAANDAHNNQNYRARFLDDGRVEWVGPNADAIDTTTVGWKEWLLLGEPDAAGWVFRWEIDPYFQSFHFVNTHILADSLTESSLAKHLRLGHVYVAFESLAPATGFAFFAQNAAGDIAAIMGDSLSADRVRRVHALSPLPGRIRLLRNGDLVATARDAHELVYSPAEAFPPGAYRVEVVLKFGESQAPWIYSNPIFIVR